MSSPAIIEVRDLHKTYHVGQVEALRGIDLDVKAGEFLSIVGPSGSGKSTLFHIIGGLTPPTSGSVRVADQNLAALTDAGRTRMRRRTVGFVFQKFNLLPNLTARDNIAVARYLGGTDSAPDAQFEEVLRAAWHRCPPGPQTERALRRRAAAYRYRARNRQPPGDSARRRADRESRHREFQSRAGSSTRFESATRTTSLDDHAQSGGRGIRPSDSADARWQDRKLERSA